MSEGFARNATKIDGSNMKMGEAKGHQLSIRLLLLYCIHQPDDVYKLIEERKNIEQGFTYQ